MKLREHPDLVRCRPRERDAPGGIVAESAAFFSFTAFRRGLRLLVSSQDLTGSAGVPTGRGADAIDEASSQGAAGPLGIADAAPARQGMEEASESDNPDQVPPRPVEARDNHGHVPPRPANWGQVTREARKHRKTR